MKILVILSFLTALTLAKRIKVIVPDPMNPLSDEYINQLNSMDSTWKAGHNFPEDTPLSYIKRLCGTKRNSSVKLPNLVHENVDNIPKKFDSRARWPHCPSIKEIRDQGNCGSCWAFATVEVITDRKCIHSKGLDKAHISAQDLITCCHKCGQGCDGGDPPPSLLYFIHEGLVTGGAYHSHSGCRPYTIPDDSGPEKKTPKCVKHCEAGYNKTYNTDKHYGKTSYSLRPSVAQIQKEIMTNGPVVADFDVYADFPNYKSGVYIRHSDDQVGGHSVKIIGWGVERKVPYWLVANSWNTDWGLKGFFKIRRGTDECGIEDNMVAGIPR